ncbi:hypothetical protein ARALYDRAFT_889962 [Arabidopsis lyrata subsp. lyrata]|uniref:Uncharacterized protein n=1 Tax=Arabidopsis lyrata subsp. lyrata TaxID=81972 RepID=D7KPG8_ARALL|nr:uncharacterized protein LOC9326670 [Arabidopsis lyrata subsp. lyrata]EFH66867.1 hypothetical protein ARALYDRAFT_889962 [Arabidopsis lyrata subsp. lyrata]|eukprot:XP_002890608.1 uncharacterized protein LOC9326670 [Arabidopsis lyrata subsp. lyrata]
MLFSLHVDEALGAQTKISKLKEMITMRRNLEGNIDYKSSNMRTGGSVSNQCHSKSYIEIVTTYLPDDSSSPCIQCNHDSCYSCTKTRKCRWSTGSPRRCTVNEVCCLIVYS